MKKQLKEDLQGYLILLAIVIVLYLIAVTVY